MSEDQSSTTSTPAATATTEIDPHAQAVLSFIEWALPKIPEELFAERYRIMSRGLFISVGEQPAIIKLYHEWCAVTSRPTELSDEKCLRKLLGPEPKRYYLLEGKVTLNGFFVACRIPDPQRYRLPFHLGTPTEASDKLLVQDPLFLELKDIELRSANGVEELLFKFNSGPIRFPMQSLALFQKLCSQSQKVSKRFPQFNDSLSEGVRALHKVLRATRPALLKDEPVQPLRFLKERRNVQCLAAWGFYFYVNRDGKVLLFYHEYGRNLTNFLRQEAGSLLAMRDRRQDILLNLSHNSSPVLGTLTLHGRKVGIDWRALGSYIRELLETPHLWVDPKEPRTLATLLQEFSRVISRCDPIDRSKIASYLGTNYRNGFRFIVNEMWLFVVSPEWLVVDCIARIGRNRADEQPARSGRSR